MPNRSIASLLLVASRPPSALVAPPSRAIRFSNTTAPWSGGSRTRLAGTSHAAPHAIPLSVAQNLACGAVARIAQIMTMFPIDTIKTRVQVSRTVATGAAGGLRQIGNAMGKGALYKGAGFSLLGQIPYGTITFGVYETLKIRLEESDIACPQWIKIMIAAVVGDALGSLWLNPSELIKSKTQAGMFDSSMAAVRATSKNGIGAFYQGYGSALARDLPFRAIQMILYERARIWYAKHKHKAAESISNVENLLIGAISGTLTAAATTPLDVIRTRMMSQGSGNMAIYKNAADCVAKTVSKEGVTALFKGIGPRCLLLGPSSAVFFLAYEGAKTFFRSRSRRQHVMAGKRDGQCVGLCSRVRTG